MSLLALVGAVALAQAGAAAHEIEAWADARLPVRDGLVLWIDASRQAAASGLRREPPQAAQGTSLTRWSSLLRYDGLTRAASSMAGKMPLYWKRTEAPLTPNPSPTEWRGEKCWQARAFR